MKKSISIIIFLGVANFLNAFANYSVMSIPEELKKNAKAVIREHSTEFEVKSPGSAVERVHTIITVLNDNGLDNADFAVGYDKFRKLSNIDIILYDEFGKKVKKVLLSDIIDAPVADFLSVADQRVKYYIPKTGQVPFTVEYSYTVNHKGILNYPDWNPYDYDFNVSVEKSKFKIIAPNEIKLRYLEKNLNTTANIVNTSGGKIYEWSCTNLPALKSEPRSVPFRDYGPVLLTGPTDFEIDDYKGTCDTWENFGKWFNLLNEGKDILTPETQQVIRDLIKDAGSDYEKAKILYEYMQNKTRYMNISLGIGGWQPFPATRVDKYSYGDCKALSMYMKTLLKYAGIKSHYALVYAGSSSSNIVKDFPNSQFNHAFLCIPFEKDTIWLECTSQILPFGYIGTFTDDRDVLLIKDDGGKIVHTRTYSKNENLQSRTIHVEIFKEGHCYLDVGTNYYGVNFDFMRSIISADDADKKKKLYATIDIPNFQLEKYSYKVNKKEVPEVIETLQIIAPNYVSLIGDRMVVPLNMMSKISEKPKKSSDRKSDIMIRRSYIDVDTVIYKFPETYQIDKLPENVEIKSQYGEYSASVKQLGNEVVYIRSFAMNKGIYPVAEYNQFVAFFDNVSSADAMKMVLKRN